MLASGREAEMNEVTEVLRIEGAVVQFDSVRAVDRVSAIVGRGQTLGVLGGSGCGKSSLAQAILNLVPLAAGAIHVLGRAIDRLNGDERRQYRRDVQLVFQDPQSSFNPMMSVCDIIAEPLSIQGIGDKAARQRRAVEMANAVGLPVDRIDSLPHGFSGGQRQRIALARALVLEPELLVLDEPTSALDLSVQGQILNLLLELQRQRGLSYVLISHNVAVVRHLADRVIVMYHGQVVEEGTAQEVICSPQHPYTQALLRAIPEVGGGNFLEISNSADEPVSLGGTGCRYAARCDRATPKCLDEQALLPIGGHVDRQVRCWRAGDEGVSQNIQKWN